MTPSDDKERPRLSDHPMFKREPKPGRRRPGEAAGQERVASGEREAAAVPRTPRSRRDPIYAIIDAARDPNGVRVANESHANCESLYAGPTVDRFAELAPYLAECPARTRLWDWWFQRLGNSVGVLVEAGGSFDALRRHLRTLMVVRGADRKKYYFRFYDPRVLRTFLPNCSGDEVGRFFGPIKAFHCEGPQGNELLIFKPRHDGVAVGRSPLQATGDRKGIKG